MSAMCTKMCVDRGVVCICIKRERKKGVYMRLIRRESNRMGID